MSMNTDLKVLMLFRWFTRPSHYANAKVNFFEKQFAASRAFSPSASVKPWQGGRDCEITRGMLGPGQWAHRRPGPGRGWGRARAGVRLPAQSQLCSAGAGRSKG